MFYRLHALFVCFATLVFAGSGNTITKSDFNFGHQLGYLYSRTDSACFAGVGGWNFETGFLGYYTAEMPLVRNPEWRERLLLLVPVSFELTPSPHVALQFDLTDLFVEFPYRDRHNAGGKSPRFRVKMGLFDEKGARPACALTVGAKFSSAKPFVIWEKRHNWEESNGLAGAGTGVADYLLLLTFTRHPAPGWALHGRLGLAPLGSPVEYVRGSGQADEIPYGLTVQRTLGPVFALKAEWAGMYNGLSSTRLAHYSVVRIEPGISKGRCLWSLNLEKGLTPESDQWVAGLRVKIHFEPRSPAASGPKENP